MNPLTDGLAHSCVAGPSLVNGDELATCASQALGMDLKFDDISEYVLSFCPGLP